MKLENKAIGFHLIATIISLLAFAPSFCAGETQVPQEVQKLNESYEREIARVLPPIQEKYIAALERLLDKYTKAGLLEEAMQTKGQIERAKQWESLPLTQFRSEKNKDVGRSDFADWLKTKSFSFQGVSRVTLEFGEDKVSWIVGGKPQEYGYKVRGKRSVIVEGAQEFKLDFVDDLSSGTFESNVGKYNLTMVDRK